MFYLPDIERCACLRRSLTDEFGRNLGPGWPLLADCNHDFAVPGRRERREEVDGERLVYCMSKEEK